MAHDLSDPEGEHRFRFSFERHIIGKAIRAISVGSDQVELLLDNGVVLVFQTDGPDIKVSIVSPAGPTLDGGPERVQ